MSKAEEIANRRLEKQGAGEADYQILRGWLLSALDEALEWAAQQIEAEDARVLACQSKKSDEFNYSIDRNIRMTTVLLPALAERYPVWPSERELCLAFTGSVLAGERERTGKK